MQDNDMEIKTVSIDQVSLWDKNPRNIKTADFKRLKKQITELGVYKPLIACKENGGYTVLGGNMRLRALKELGIKEVGISIVKAETEAKKIKYALSDNDRAGEYDEQQLAELVYPHIEEISLEDYKVDLGEAIDLKEAVAEFGPDGPDWGAALSGLPDGDRAPFQQMTFTLHDDQVEQVNRAVKIAMKLGDFTGLENQNRNGNALAFVCETFVTEHGQS